VHTRGIIRIQATVTTLNGLGANSRLQRFFNDVILFNHIALIKSYALYDYILADQTLILNQGKLFSKEL
jgi:hypothetical protein